MFGAMSHGLLITLISAVLALSAGQNLPITQEQITVSGYKCGTIQTAMIYYPSDAGTAANKTYPLAAFGHGWTCGGTAMKRNYKEILEDLAATGYVVIASESGSVNLCMSNGANHADQRRSLEFVLEESAKYGAMVDRSMKTAVYGHSMGGGASGVNAANQSTVDRFNIGAAFLIHPASQGNHLTKVPTFYSTGTSDFIVSSGSVERIYPYGQTSKILATILGAGHFEANNACSSIGCVPGQRRWTPYILSFFECHIRGVQEDCDFVWNICDNFSQGTLSTCKFEDAPNTSPPSTPPPTTDPGDGLFDCSECTANGFGSDGCACGHCGSFGACTFSCDPSSPYYSGKECRL